MASGDDALERAGNLAEAEGITAWVITNATAQGMAHLTRNGYRADEHTERLVQLGATVACGLTIETLAREHLLLGSEPADGI